MTTTTTTTAAKATTAMLPTHSALETLLMTTTPQLMKDDRNAASSEKKKYSESMNGNNINSLEKRTSKNGNEFTVSYANSRLCPQMAGNMSRIPCSNLDVQTPTKALFTNQNSEQEQELEEELHQHQKENQQQKECTKENDEENVHCTITNTEEAIIHVKCMEESKESSNINNNSRKDKKCDIKSSGSCNKTVAHAATVGLKIMEEPSTLLFLTPTYRNKVYAALQQINNNAELSAIDCDNVITSSEEEKKAVNNNDSELLPINKNSSNTYNENIKTENGCSNYNEEAVIVDGGSSEKSDNTTENIYNLSGTDAYTQERQIFTNEEVYNLLKSTLTKYELQRDEEEANVLSHLRTEMDALQEKYEVLCVERQKTEKEKQELECELKRVITTLEELMKNKMSHDADMQERLQETQHLLAEKEKVICELKEEIHEEQRKTSYVLSTSTHNTSAANTELLPKTTTETLLSTSEETLTKTRAITTNCDSERLVNANAEEEEISLAQCANDALAYCTMENCDNNDDDEVTEMTTVNEIMSKMNEMHHGMTAMESTLKEQEARIMELERDLLNKENQCKELEKANTELQERDGKFTQNYNKTDKEWISEIESLQSTINAQRKEMQTQTRKMIALQNERNSHISFSRDLESFTQMLLHEQSEIYTKLAKLNNNGVNKTSSKLRKIIALLHKTCNVTMRHTEVTDEVNAAATIIDYSSINNNSANNRGSVNKVITHCETKEEGEVDSFDDGNVSITPYSSSTVTNIYDFANKSCKQQNISGKMSKAIRLLEVRRRAIARVVQQIERQLLSIMVTCDKAYHHCKMTAQQESPHSSIKENDSTLFETNSKLVSEKQTEISNLHQKSKYILCKNNSNNNNMDVYTVPESNTNATSPSPHRPSNSNNKFMLHSSSSPSARRNNYHSANAIQLCSTSEEYSSSRHGLSVSQETEHTEITNNTNGDKYTVINNVHSDRVNWHLPRTNANECLQVGAVLDGGSLCPLPPPRLRVCD